ncbi:Uncharacterized protein AArcCO_1022 [Halalkaliarchaeum sp. AArc-CO]|nr:Uncharacterized protein AArcCO_1022 [Halalkaliarchaeum sp. AArc-CO]
MPEALLEGWRPIEDRTERPFQAGPIAVNAHTIVYEDETRRRRIRESIGSNADTVWRFYVVSRLRLTPRTSTSTVLTRIVESNAMAAFERKLHERGFESVSRTGRRTLEIRGTLARMTQFDAIVPVPGLGVDVAARAALAVRPGDREYILAGGAYPRELIGDDGDRVGTGSRSRTDENDAEALAEYLDPEADRSELLRLIRSTS